MSTVGILSSVKAFNYSLTDPSIQPTRLTSISNDEICFCDNASLHLMNANFPHQINNDTYCEGNNVVRGECGIIECFRKSMQISHNPFFRAQSLCKISNNLLAITDSNCTLSICNIETGSFNEKALCENGSSSGWSGLVSSGPSVMSVHYLSKHLYITDIETTKSTYTHRLSGNPTAIALCGSISSPLERDDSASTSASPGNGFNIAVGESGLLSIYDCRINNFGSTNNCSFRSIADRSGNIWSILPMYVTF